MTTAARAAALVVALLPVALLLQGCGPRRACKIDDIYALIQVDGRTGLTKHELSRAGVKLCARHLRKEETYSNDACTEPEQVFHNGDLPTPANGDSNALLLVQCPSNTYPKGKELQRVTCSDDFMGEGSDGSVEKALHLRFDNYERASNCLLSGNTSVEWDEEDNATEPDEQEQIMARTRNQTTNARAAHLVATAGKVLRSADHIDVVAPTGSRIHTAELLAASAAAAAMADMSDAHFSMAKTGVSIHPQGTIDVHRHIHEHPHHRHEHVAKHEPASHHEPAMLHGNGHGGSAVATAARRPGPLFRTEIIAPDSK